MKQFFEPACWVMVTYALIATSACTLPPQRAYEYVCPDGYKFSIKYSGDRDPGDVAILEDASRKLKLPRAPAASGERYSDGSTVFWSKGSEAMILRGTVVEHAGCSTNLDQAASST